MFLSPQELEKRKKHNANIYEVPEVLDNGILLGDFVIVRRMYFEETTVSENGVIKPQYEAYHTDAGVAKAKFNENPFSPIAVVLKVGDGDYASKYKVGDKVWLDYRILGRGMYTLPLDMNKPVAESEGIERMPVSNILFIESRLED